MSLLLGPLSRREVPPYLLDRRLGGPHSSSGRCEETETCAFTGNRTPVCRPAPKALKGNGFSLHEIGVRGSRGIAPLFLDVCTTCICVVSFALRLFYPLAQRSRCPLSRKVDKSTTCQSITQHFILYTIKIVYCQGDMFRPLLGHLQVLWENRFKSCGIPNAFGIPQCIEIQIALESVFPEDLKMT